MSSTRWRRLLALVASWVVRIWTGTLRYQCVGQPPPGPALLAFWHGEQLPLLGQRANLVAPVAAVSRSRDGRLQAEILRRLGIGSIAGSSSRGGSRAARGLLRALGTGATALLAVDGPRGPRHRVKPGVTWLAAKTRLPIWPIGVAVGGRRLHAWDRYLLPRPFARAVVLVGEPLRIDPGDDLEGAGALLESRLHAAEAAAHALLEAPR